MLETNLRYDDLQGFHPITDGGLPSVSGGWYISEEAFGSQLAI